MANYKSWAWLTGEPVGRDNQTKFENYEFDPNAIYHEGPHALRDGDDDGFVATKNAGDGVFHDNDGWLFEQVEYHVDRWWTFEATVFYKDGKDASIRVWAARLDQDGRPVTGKYHNTMLFRFADNAMRNAADGSKDNGDGEYLYDMNDISSIKIGKYVNETTRRARKDIDDFWPEAVCFTRGTLIQTAHGCTPVENLRKDDLILTRDNGLQPLRWIGSQKFLPNELVKAPHLKPICISAGALGKDVPSSDLIVSPQHRVLIRSKIAQRMFGADEVLVAAKQLSKLDGIDVAEDISKVEYFHFLFDQHEIVFANGAEAESLYTGSRALHSVGDMARKEIFAIFPELRNQDHVANSARPLVRGRAARQLANRHVKNNLELVD